MNLSPQQDAALMAASRWLKTCRRQRQASVFRLFGYAGTGKTSIAKLLARDAGGLVCFGAFTGKAALVMKRNGCEGASTIHSLIYKDFEEEEGTSELRVSLNPDSKVRNAKLVIIDECSMVGEVMARDLLSFNVPVLVLGDPAQLPPVEGAGFFINGKPDAMLTEIHRQAAESPIVRLATTVRQGGQIEIGRYGDSAEVIRRADLDPNRVMSADVMLCGTNNTRQGLNGRMRTRRGHLDLIPDQGEPVICLKNDREKRIFNGGIFRLLEKARMTRRGMVEMKVSPDDSEEDREKTVHVRPEFFAGTEKSIPRDELRGQQFTYGYAITVHKSQGSQWRDVVLFDESRVFKDDAVKHLYTGITRAAERLTIAV